MALRWGCAMLLQAEKRFRRIRGSRSMPVLAAALGRTVSQENAIDTRSHSFVNCAIIRPPEFQRKIGQLVYRKVEASDDKITNLQRSH